MKELLAKYVVVMVTSAVKYLIGIFTAVGTGLNFLETLLCTVSGGMIGVIVYLYLWEAVLYIYHKIRPPKPRQHKPIGRHRRKLLRFIVKYEILGIVILTPILLSVPVGTILAAAFEDNKWKIKRYMLFSFTAYSIVFYLFGDMLANGWHALVELF